MLHVLKQQLQVAQLDDLAHLLVLRSRCVDGLHDGCLSVKCSGASHCQLCNRASVVGFEGRRYLSVSTRCSSCRSCGMLIALSGPHS